MSNSVELNSAANISEAEIREALNLFNKDNKGLVSVIEFRHIMKSLGEKLAPEEVDEFIRELDIDNDNNIKYEDIIQLLMSEY